MASDRQRASAGSVSSLKPNVGNGSAGHPWGDGILHTEEWVRNTLANTQVGLDWMNQFQNAILQTAIHWQEALILALCDSPMEKSPLELAASEGRMVSRQLEDFSTQSSALLQQLCDAQLILMGRMLRR